MRCKPLGRKAHDIGSIVPALAKNARAGHPQFLSGIGKSIQKGRATRPTNRHFVVRFPSCLTNQISEGRGVLKTKGVALVCSSRALPVVSPFPHNLFLSPKALGQDTSTGLCSSEPRNSAPPTNSSETPQGSTRMHILSRMPPAPAKTGPGTKPFPIGNWGAGHKHL